MPSTIDPKVTAATIALKREQTRITAAKRKRLERDYWETDEVQAFVLDLARQFRFQLLQLPVRLRAVFPGPVQLEVGDAFEKVVDDFMREIAETKLELPKLKRSTYSSKPGPKPKSR